jgi:hypothetical protein
MSFARFATIGDLGTEGRRFCFPTTQTRLAELLRRFAPGLVWSMIHRIEGR